MSKVIGDVILDVHNISLSFGGVKALADISFNVREHEIRAIIGLITAVIFRERRNGRFRRQSNER